MRRKGKSISSSTLLCYLGKRFTSLSLGFLICEVGLGTPVNLMGWPRGLNKMGGGRVEIVCLYSIMSYYHLPECPMANKCLNSYQLISRGPAELLRGTGPRAV